MPRAAVGGDNALRSRMHTALSTEKDPTVAGSLRIGDQNWVIGALIVASLINESSANIRRSVCPEPVYSLGQPSLCVADFRRTSPTGHGRSRVVAGALNDAQIFQPPAIGARGGSLLTCSRHRRRSTALRGCSASLGSAVGATQVPLSESEVPGYTFEKSPLPGSTLTESNRRPSPYHEPPPGSETVGRGHKQAKHEPTRALASHRQALTSAICHSTCHSL
jgi:hypothetical protein